MYEDIFESIRKAAEKRNLRERTIQLYCSNIRYFLRCTNKPVTDLTLEDADAFLTMKRLEGGSPETHNHYRSSIKFLYKRVLKIALCRNLLGCMKYISRLKNLDAPAILKLLYNKDFCKCPSCGGNIVPLPVGQYYARPEPHLLC